MRMDSTRDDPEPRDATGSDSTVAEPSRRRGRDRVDDPVAAGTLIGRYVVLERIGAGGMGVVYAAYDPELGRRVALKVMQPSAGGSTGGHARMLREAQALARLSHPNVVTIYDVGSAGEQVFLAMELVDGKTLDDLTPREGFRIPLMLRYAVQAADALAKAHAAGIVHRDLKPGNIMVTGDGLVKVLDFGLAKLVQSPSGDPREGAHTAATASDAGIIVGTAAFMSPEQAEGKPVDAR
jgi:serine/threonine protein kinase